jgi:PAS domain S-box-containing protein
MRGGGRRDDQRAAEGADRAADADAARQLAVEQHRLLYRQLFEFAVDGQVVSDSRGVILEANRAAATILRCPMQFLVGKPLGLFVTAGTRYRFYECLSRLSGGVDYDEFQTTVGRRGELRDVMIWASTVQVEAGVRPAIRWLIRDVTERLRAEAARDELLRRLVTVQEDERRRVARELHDSVGQLLSALLLTVRAARDAGPLPPAVLARLDEIHRLADELGRTTHELAVRLRPTALDDVGLSAALRHYVEEWSAMTGTEVQFQTVGLESARLPPDVETTLYRFVQEALTNVLKHAGARHIGVVVERHDGRAIAVVEDDGVGFDPEAAAGSGRLGLIGMRERLALVRGRLEVESSPGAGTTAIAQVPL